MSVSREEYQAFFSYSHLDAISDPALIMNFTELLETRVNARLTNANFSIWTDKARLKTGFKWNKKIIGAIKKSKIMIVLMTPKWIDSDYCRKEFYTFLEVESEFDVGEYVAPILARTLKNQIRHFNEDQRKAYEELTDRQYTQALARDFLLLSSDDRGVLLEK